MHIFDFRWDEKNASPYFEIRNGKTLDRKYLAVEEDVFLTLSSSDLHCVGAKVKGEYQSCPHNNTGQKKCESCKKLEDYFPCQFCNGFNCSRFRDEKIANCDTDHMVYLALFDKDLVKVGVSGMKRGKSRQFEQGSHFTQVLAEGMSGVMARRIETTLIRSGFPDKIPATKKKNIIFPEITLEEGKNILSEKFIFATDQVVSMMPEMKKFLILPEKKEEMFWDMRHFYAKNFEELLSYHLPIHVLEIEEGESIGGKLIMVKGSFLVIHTGTDLAILLAKKFVGQDLSFEPCARGITKNGGFQGGLF